jgi:hypothetical protein
MKKISFVIAAMLAAASVFTVAPAQAQSKSLVVVDSYFDSRVGSTPIVCVEKISCVIDTRIRSTSLSHPQNHGVALVDAARSKFPGVSVIALRTTSNSTTEMNVGHLVSALEWAVKNKDAVAALSISRKMNGTQHNKTGCDANATNTAHLGGKDKADIRVRELISQLKLSGIPVFVSTGNTRGSLVDYPACIAETESVSTGQLNSLGNAVSSHSFNENTDYFVSISGSRPSITSTIFGLIPNTTSLATVLAAAKYTAESNLTKFISVLP